MQQAYVCHPQLIGSDEEPVIWDALPGELQSALEFLRTLCHRPVLSQDPSRDDLTGFGDSQLDLTEVEGVGFSMSPADKGSPSLLAGPASPLSPAKRAVIMAGTLFGTGAVVGGPEGTARRSESSAALLSAPGLSASEEQASEARGTTTGAASAEQVTVEVDRGDAVSKQNTLENGPGSAVAILSAPTGLLTIQTESTGYPIAERSADTAANGVPRRKVSRAAPVSGAGNRRASGPHPVRMNPTRIYSTHRGSPLLLLSILTKPVQLRFERSYAGLLLPSAVMNDNDPVMARYHADYLDDSKLRDETRTQVLHIRGAYHVSLITQRSTTALSINDEFMARHGHWVPEKLTLTKIRKLRRLMRKCAEEMDLDIGTLAMANIHFDVCILRHRVTKQNRRIVAACCLLLASKMHEPRLHDKAFVPNLISCLQSTFGETRRRILDAEMEVFAEGLHFELIPKKTLVVAWWKRIRAVRDC